MKRQWYNLKRLWRLARPSAAERRFMKTMGWGWMLLNGVKREHPIGPYFADFAIPRRRLVIEIDGHDWHKDYVADWGRDRHLETLGWATLRIKASDLWRNPSAVKRRVKSVL